MAEKPLESVPHRCPCGTLTVKRRRGRERFTVSEHRIPGGGICSRSDERVK